MFVFCVYLVWVWWGFFGGVGFFLWGCFLERILMLFAALFFLLITICVYGRGGAELCPTQGTAER